MNEITCNGILRRDMHRRKYAPGYVYWLDVKRKSGAVDVLMVLSPDDCLTEGFVTLTGHMRAEWIPKVGVPVFIVPDTITEDWNTACRGHLGGTLTGRLKGKFTYRDTKTTKISGIAYGKLATDEGMIPVLLWGDTAKRAAKRYKPGDRVKVSGWLQSRKYTDKEGRICDTYEFSGRNISAVK